MTSLPGKRPRKPAAAVASPNLLTESPVVSVSVGATFLWFTLCCADSAKVLSVVWLSEVGGCGMCSRGTFLTLAGPPICFT